MINSNINMNVNETIDSINGQINNFGSFLGDALDKIIKLYNSGSLKGLFIVLSTIWVVGLILLFLYLLLRFDREYYIKIPKDDSFDFPENTPVDDLDIIFHKRISPRSFLSMIAMLLYKRDIIIEKKSVLGTNKEVYVIKKSIDKPIESLTEKEEKFRNKLFKTYGKNNEIQLSEFRQKSNNPMDRIKLYNLFLDWQLDLTTKMDINKFYEPLPIRASSVYNYMIFGTLIYILSFKYYKMVAIYFLLNIPMIIYLYKISRRTKYANETRKKWLQFNNNLDHISKLPLKECPHAKLWLKYYAYTLILDSDKQFCKHLFDKEPKTIVMDEDDLSEYYNDLRNAKKVIEEINIALLMSKEKTNR